MCYLIIYVDKNNSLLRYFILDTKFDSKPFAYMADQCLIKKTLDAPDLCLRDLIRLINDLQSTCAAKRPLCATSNKF